ncbi:MAG: FkbM family methyltransferase [Limisphaerales bacterium]
MAIHAFEPLPKTYQDLISCIHQAGLSDIITSHNLGVSSTDGEAFIQMPDGIHSGMAEITANSALGARIPTRQLDSLGLPPPDFIKIDVEDMRSKC